jgi:F-type H+-transporting ATPase subunit delta
MLVDRRRLDLLEDVRIACQELSDLRTGTLRIEVTSAEPLVPAESESLARRIEETTGKRVVLEQASDPSIIGGLVVRIGGTVMDASLRQQLAGAGKRLRAE